MHPRRRLFLKCDANRGSLTRLAGRFDLSVVIANCVLDNGQSRTGSAGLSGMAFIHAVEALKHLRNADAGVAHSQKNAAAFPINADRYRVAVSNLPGDLPPGIGP